MCMSLGHAYRLARLCCYVRRQWTPHPDRGLPMSTKPSPLAPLDPLQRYTIAEAASYLRIHRCTLYVDIAAGRIAPFMDRKRRFVPGSEIARRSAISDAQVPAA